jgi:energy-coupling factor transport system substrate-specific component
LRSDEADGEEAEVALLAGYGVVAGLAYGLALDLWFWPFSLDDGSAVAYVAGAPVATNLGRFWVFHLTTSMGWDLPRAATNALLMVLAGPAVLAALTPSLRSNTGPSSSPLRLAL